MVKDNALGAAVMVQLDNFGSRRVRYAQLDNLRSTLDANRVGCGHRSSDELFGLN